MIRAIAFFSTLILLTTSCIPSISEWGNSIEFVNELGFEIDSLAFTVCDTITMLHRYEGSDGENVIGTNPAFPSSGYPCPVKIRVYSGKQIKELLASPYDCYHCDNSKYYILRGDSAVFQTYYLVE